MRLQLIILLSILSQGREVSARRGQQPARAQPARLRRGRAHRAVCRHQDDRCGGQPTARVELNHAQPTPPSPCSLRAPLAHHRRRVPAGDHGRRASRVPRQGQRVDDQGRERCGRRLVAHRPGVWHLGPCRRARVGQVVLEPPQRHRPGALHRVESREGHRLVRQQPWPHQPRAHRQRQRPHRGAERGGRERRAYRFSRELRLGEPGRAGVPRSPSTWSRRRPAALIRTSPPPPRSFRCRASPRRVA